MIPLKYVPTVLGAWFSGARSFVGFEGTGFWVFVFLTLVDAKDTIRISVIRGGENAANKDYGTQRWAVAR